MPPKRKQAVPSRKNQLDGFTLAVEEALNHVTDVAWLGAHSSLASPYLLSGFIDINSPEDVTTAARGQALKTMLQEAAEQLEEEQQKLLKLCYFDASQRLNRTRRRLAELMGMAERTFFRHQAKAIAALADTLYRLLRPALRHESPVDKVMIGRSKFHATSLAKLQAGQTVTLMGSSGIGKTTLGGTIAQSWSLHTAIDNSTGQPSGQTRSPVFWFTLHAGLNDQVNSFIFAIAHFLHTWEAGHTWRQLIANRGDILPEMMLQLIRYDLSLLPTRSLLFCIDDVDTLQVERNEHAQITYLLEEIRLLVPLLLIGQRAVIESDVYLTLTGLAHSEVVALFSDAGLPPLAPTAEQQLLQVTQGKPAMLVLCIALIHSGESLDDLLPNVLKSPSLEAIFNRIWRRVSHDEQFLLMQLAVFRGLSPQDAWAEQHSVLQDLHLRGLVQFDRQGGVRLLPQIHQLVYERIPAEFKVALHLLAAQIRETRGDYVSAMYHYLVCRQPEHALWLWFSRRSLAIEDGHGSAALALLNTISTTDLVDGNDHSVLRAARAELLQIAGKPEDAEAELDAITDTGSPAFTAYIRQLRGNLMEIQGRIEQALSNYRASLDLLVGTGQQREVTLHTQLSFLQMYRLHNADAAKKEALRALVLAEAFYGNIEEMAGNYDTARRSYESARRIAEDRGSDLVTLARIYTYLSTLTLKQGDFTNAIELIEKAIDCETQRGDLISPLYDRLNLAYVYTLTGQYQESYDEAFDALSIASKINHSYLIAGLAAGVAEASYHLNNLKDAELYATQSLQTEEEFFCSSALVIIGLVRQQQGKNEEAVRLIQEAVDNARDLQDKYNEAYAWHMLGTVFHTAKNFTEARHALDTSLLLYQELGIKYKTAEVSELIDTLPASAESSDGTDEV